MDSDEGPSQRGGKGPQGDEPTLKFYTHPRVLALRGPAPFFVIHNPKNDLAMYELYDALLNSTVRKPTNEGPNVCTFAIKADYSFGPVEMARATTVEGTVIRRVKAAALYHAKRIHAQCKSLPSDDWEMVVEAEFMAHRSTTTDTLHRDDYVRPGRASVDGGVAFVVLQYFMDGPLFGPELIVDIGPDGGSGEVTYPQLVSLPPDLIRSASSVQRGELLRRKRDKVIRVHCPTIPAWGAVCFCEPMVFHMSPTLLGPARTGHGNKVEYWSDHPVVVPFHTPLSPSLEKLREIGVRPIPLFGSEGNLPLSRQLTEEESKKSEAWKNTFERTRSFIRLTFRARPV